MIEMITEGMVIFTELKKPGAKPVQLRPVQALLQAAIQGSMVGACGRLKICPSRTSGMLFSEVTTIT